MPPPELHTFMGGTNNPVDLLIKKYGRERVEGWLQQVGVIRHGYNGGGMDGNNCKRLLDRLDAFVQLLLPETAPIVAVICSLRDVFQGVNHQSSLHLLKVNKADRHKTDGPTNRQSGL